MCDMMTVNNTIVMVISILVSDALIRDFDDITINTFSILAN